MSITQMFKTLGYDAKHVPGPGYFEMFPTYDMMADTPMFTRYAIDCSLEMSDDVKFIYINKPVADWVQSFEKVGLDRAYTNMRKQVNAGITLNIHQQTDYDALNDIMRGDEFNMVNASKRFIEHYAHVHNVIPKERLLDYDFSDGWGTLCEFIGVEEPNLGIPHLNKNTMFDVIV